MIFLIADHIVVPVHQRGNNAHVGLKPGPEGDDARLAQKFCKLGLQLQMQLQCAVEKAGTGAACSVFFQRLYAGFDDLGMNGQAQIIVGAQHDAALALHGDLYILP